MNGVASRAGGQRGDLVRTGAEHGVGFDMAAACRRVPLDVLDVMRVVDALKLIARCRPPVGERALSGKPESVQVRLNGCQATRMFRMRAGDMLAEQRVGIK